ncbi:MAG: hypothetical protein P8Y23_16490 [Candidatus Lokiarchaeota archaeon]
MESKVKKILSIIIIFISIGIFLISVPFPNSEIIFRKENSVILSDVAYFDEIRYPWRSINQLINVNMESFNGTFTFLILDEEDLSNWLNNESYKAYYQDSNLTEIKTTISIDPPYLGYLTLIIIAESYLNYKATIIIEYYNFFTSWGGLLIGIGLILILYQFVVKWKQKRFKQNYEQNHN